MNKQLITQDLIGKNNLSFEETERYNAYSDIFF